MVALTLMTGLFYLVAGIARLGFIANFLSQPILVGYLNGIALIILIGQLPKLCGFAVQERWLFSRRLPRSPSALGATHLPTLILGATLLVLLVALQRLAPRLPGALIVAMRRDRRRHRFGTCETVALPFWAASRRAFRTCGCRLSIWPSSRNSFAMPPASC